MAARDSRNSICFGRLTPCGGSVAARDGRNSICFGRLTPHVGGNVGGFLPQTLGGGGDLRMVLCHSINTG